MRPEGRQGELSVGGGEVAVGNLRPVQGAKIEEGVRPRAVEQEERAWDRHPTEREEIELLEEESFEETLAMMGDWRGNKYDARWHSLKSTLTGPSSLRVIINCRRFAKLMEETEEGVSAEQVEAILNRLEIDLAQWRGLSASGQHLTGFGSKTISGRGLDHSDLIVPLTMQINATVLLIGERSVEEALPLVLETADTIGMDTNWSVVGYACDKIMTSVNRAQMSGGQLEILDEYLEWKAGLENKSFSEYRVVELDSFRTVKWEEGMTPEGKVSVEMPPMYNVFLEWERNFSAPKGYLDASGNNRIGRRIVKYARMFAGGGVSE